jgi:hypothetical protein
VLLRCSEDAVYSQLEGQWIATFEPGAFHEFCLTTSDVVDYELFIDGQPVHVGEFRGPVSYRDAFWGDQVQGTSSLSTWDFVRFAVVPEPAGWLLLGFGGLLAVKHKPG